MTFWLDTDVFIQAKNKPYKFEEVPEFWIFLSVQLDAGNIRCGKMQYRELTRGNDDLSDWCKQRREKGMCVTASKDVNLCYKKIMNYVYSNYKYVDAEVFGRDGDGWVIAHAMAENDTVVSFEVKRKTKTKVKIPAVCNKLNVKCIDLYDMLPKLKFKTSDYKNY